LTSTQQHNIFDNLLDNKLPSSSDDELQHYLATDVEDVKDGLMWWYERRAMYPRLSRMAHDYLAIPGEYLAFSQLSEELKLLSHSHN
jgi:hAT family C-terminal dimerisation region